VQQFGYWHPQPIFLRPDAFDADAFYRYRNSGAMQLVLVPLLLAATLHETRPSRRAMLLLWLGINAVTLATTGFRGAWLGMVVGGWLMLGWRRGLRLAPVAATLLALSVAALSVYAPARDNLVLAAVKRGFSDNNRIERVWKPALELIAESPLQGHGFAPLSFSRAYAARREARNWGPEVMPDAHNMTLKFAFQAGWPGAGAYLVLIAALVYGSWRWRRAPEGDPPLARAALAGWVGAYLVLGQTDSVNWPCFAVLLPLTMAILGCAKRRTIS
jgi:O-antigen ligase